MKLIELEVGSIHKIKSQHQSMMSAPFLAHIRECGNRFMVLGFHKWDCTYDMKCLGCNKRFNTHSPGLYELAETLHTDNPNTSFKRQKGLKQDGKSKSSV